ncbi:hypothetical protein B0H14DRAFT_3632166 [Mycena olivaceomarginata]|nr:hypothetical protein B0H14DRAFT_3632166 [Mycena olivaceomarginata]
MQQHLIAQLVQALGADAECVCLGSSNAVPTVSSLTAAAPSVSLPGPLGRREKGEWETWVFTNGTEDEERDRVGSGSASSAPWSGSVTSYASEAAHRSTPTPSLLQPFLLNGATTWLTEGSTSEEHGSLTACARAGTAPPEDPQILSGQFATPTPPLPPLSPLPDPSTRSMNLSPGGSTTQMTQT